MTSSRKHDGEIAWRLLVFASAWTTKSHLRYCRFTGLAWSALARLQT